jgi:hypothetical protein
MATIRRFFDAHGELLDLAAHDQAVRLREESPLPPGAAA